MIYQYFALEGHVFKLCFTSQIIFWDVDVCFSFLFYSSNVRVSRVVHFQVVQLLTAGDKLESQLCYCIKYIPTLYRRLIVDRNDQHKPLVYCQIDCVSSCPLKEHIPYNQFVRLGQKVYLHQSRKWFWHFGFGYYSVL